MASSGNTWCKKLMVKDKRNKCREVFGTSARFREDLLAVDRAAEKSFFTVYQPHKRLTSR